MAHLIHTDFQNLCMILMLGS